MLKLYESQHIAQRCISGLSWPVNPKVCVLTSGFLAHRNGRPLGHMGKDYAPPQRLRRDLRRKFKIYAVADGQCFKKGWQNPRNHREGYGLRVWQTIEVEGKKFDIFYGHMFYIHPLVGRNIREGQLLGYMGFTGSCYSNIKGADGLHLHIECRKHLTRRRYDMEFDHVPESIY